MTETTRMSPSIADLYQSREGKVSDKWELYLREYERLLSPFRSAPVSLLEIGIQNGGSLERWARYLPNAVSLVGCDINESCRALRYEDERIAVIVGDANAPEISEQILSRSAAFDIVIDDGSHRSSDIVKSFAKFFPALNDGGVFVAEDLHCSYWHDYEGGLFYPLSAIAFFKRLADIVSHEHWGVPVARGDILTPFVEAYGHPIDEEVLASIHSVEFVNSICVVTKSAASLNTLGKRIVSGHEDIVWPGAKALHMQNHVSVVETSNEWNDVSRLPEVERIQLQKSITTLGEMNRDLADRLTEAEKRLTAADQRDVMLRDSLDIERAARRSAERVHAAEVQEIRQSTSWRITAPLRRIRSFLK